MLKHWFSAYPRSRGRLCDAAASYSFGNRRFVIFSSGSEPLAADHKAAASYDVDSRVAGPVSLSAATLHAQPSADGEKSQTAGDTALTQLCDCKPKDLITLRDKRPLSC